VFFEHTIINHPYHKVTKQPKYIPYCSDEEKTSGRYPTAVTLLLLHFLYDADLVSRSWCKADLIGEEHL
jgi:hypothetical protein